MEGIDTVEQFRKHIDFAHMEIDKDKYANANKRWFCRIWVPSKLVDTVIELRAEAEDKRSAVGRMIVYLAQVKLLDDFSEAFKKELVINAPEGMFPNASKA